MSKLTALTSLEELRILRGLYQRNYKNNTSIVGFHTLDNFIKWFECDPELKHVTVYIFDDQWQQNGGFLILDRYALFLDSLIPADENLGKALKLLDWSRGYKITSVPESHYTIVTTVLRDLNIQWREVKLHVLRLTKERAAQFEISCPAEYELCSLNQSMAPIINSYWYSKQAGSLFFFERLIKHNLCGGIYRRDTQELIAWYTRCQNGFIGSLFVKENYRRQGLAELLIKDFSKRLATSAQPEDAFSNVNVLNNISNGLFAKMGFEIVTDVFHLVAFRAPAGMEWPLNDCLEKTIENCTKL